ncbi:MAG: efflux RND transporter permease subunit [Porticoccaceae bacterium]
MISILHRIPQHVDVEYVFDTSTGIKETVDELSGNVISAMALVMVIVVAALGFRSGMLVGFGIPFSLLGSGIVVYLMGYSFNFMVIFGLLLSLGMLIDGALVVTEYASRKLSEGASTYDAYVGAARRMAIPIVASTLTTLAAFLPLMFWPGVVGDFMAILPVTVFSVLIWSLVFSLLVVPILGVRLLTSKPGRVTNSEDGDDAGVEFQGLRNFYLNGLKWCLSRPMRTASFIIIMLVVIFVAYGKFGAGTVFGSAESEDSFTTMSIRAQGNLTVAEKIELVKTVEERLAVIPEVKSYYASTNGFGGGSRPRDEIAGVLLELLHSRDRELTSTESLDKVRAHTSDIPGIIVQVNKIENGPPVGKDVQIELSSIDRELLHNVAGKVRSHLDSMPGLIDVEDTLSLPGIEWQFFVDKAAAAMHGVDVRQIGQVVQMVTDGLYLGEYRPDDADEEVEIRLRFPESFRSLDALQRLRVATPQGTVPVSSFVTMEARPRVDVIERVDSTEVVNVSAYTREGVLASDMVAEIDNWLVSEGLSGQVDYRFRGASEETDESARFLSSAFSLAMFLMLIILVAQFNSFYQAGLIISAVVMSTAGVMLGNMLTQQPFSILLTGVGLVALAGIVVNNNIVLIDTFNRLRKSFPEKSSYELALDSAKRRFRPVLLTTLTTVIGLMPLANGTSVDLINRSVIIGGPVASFWSAMAATIVNGLAFSTILTLVFTPTMLVLPEVMKSKLSGLLEKGRLRFGGLRRQQ